MISQLSRASGISRSAALVLLHRQAARNLLIKDGRRCLSSKIPGLQDADLAKEYVRFDPATNNAYNPFTPVPPSYPLPSECCPSAEGVKDPFLSWGDVEELEPPPKTFFQRLHDKYSIRGQQHCILVGEKFFQACQKQAMDPRWFGPGRVPRDFRNRHAILTMHIWFLHKRLISDTKDKNLATLIQKEFFDAFWDDTTNRIRSAGVNELVVNRSLMKVQQYTFLHLVTYDHAFTELLHKPEERLKALRYLVWCHILLKDPEYEQRYDYIDRIVWYIEANYQNIVMDWPDEYYRQARVKWVDLPDFSNIKDKDGTFLEENPINPEDVLPKPWAQCISTEGIWFYWNPKTRKATWDRSKVTGVK